MKRKMVSKETFLAYEVVRRSGATNMFDVQAVGKFARALRKTPLSKDEIVEIMEHYDQYEAKYLSKSTV